MIPNIQNAHDPATRNIINAAIDSINAQGKSIQDLVAEGQLTTGQYAELITVINGHLKSGDVDFYDFNKNTRTKIDDIEDRISSVIKGLDGSEELYTPIELGEFLTVQNESWVV